MDVTPTPNIISGPPVPFAAAVLAICPQCHQSVLPQYYFCPNCGKKLEDQPLSTTIWAQVWLYVFSLILMPITCYFIYSRWKGTKYFKSKDPKAHQMGLIAIVLLIISIVFLIWSTWAGTVWLDKYVQTQINSLSNADTLQ
jgi:heme/copper-type cytochrome/quinol oxidase subunit 2